MDRTSPAPRPVRRSPRTLPALALLLVLGSWQAEAQAVGIGRPQTQSALGQGLNLLFPVRLGSEESLNPECVQAEVMAGDNRLQAQQVWIQLEGESEASVRAVRVRSTMQIDEPVVTVNLTVGCTVRLTRQFTAFIDPPDARSAALVEPSVMPPQLSPALRAALSTSEARPSQLLAAPAREAVTRPVFLAPPADAASAAASASAAARPAKPAQAAKPKVKSRKPAPEPATALASARDVKPAPGSTEAAGRLQLEAPEVLETVAAAASRAAAAEDRVARMEAGMQKLQSLSQSQQQELQQLRQQLNAAREQRPGDERLLYGLGLLSLSLAGLAAYLWRARRDDQRRHAEAWWQQEQGSVAAQNEPEAVSAPVAEAEASSSSTSPDAEAAEKHALSPAAAMVAAAAALATAESTLEVTQDPKEAEAPPAEASHSAFLTELIEASYEQPDWLNAAQAVQAATGDSEPLSVQLLDDAGPVAMAAQPAPAAEAFSVEELIDLEQQVDFFLVLGQEQAAIDLLNERLGERQRGAALPHLKLLELLHKRGDRASFERIAADFSSRFQARAPDWSEDISRGHEVADYAGAMGQIESHWSDAGASMALLQKLLAQGDEAGHGFDLPAYKDLLLLYAVARDRSEHEVRGEEIDLFLPLDAAARASAPAAAAAGMMATMVWQAPAGAPVAPSHLEVDISLDDPLTRH
ncbi:hypothetical protein RQP53_01645 [Paucibacter sp. APW11]|uniref:Tfp pilus assembly protein FimV n=1 Tax=Roseateles aquae TaxID=3077235 RepID=A0ABU3P799_9BURK|nr:hypothetical protein [Paucibacter sp. APW11]MDT8997973.1 hypothetical protein [Paucibacter sp. APW11]